MNMDLPKKFNDFFESDTIVAYVEDDILKIDYSYNFRKVVIKSVYMENEKEGKYHCYYCNKEIKREEGTLDHLYPQDYGGPWITNNLQVSCGECNNKKTNMTEKQYELFKQEKEKGKAKEFKKRLREEQKKLTEKNLPTEWLTSMKLNDIIITNRNSNSEKGSNYNRIKEVYDERKYINRIIVIDRNNVLLLGSTVYVFAVDNEMEELDVIKLDNVEILYP